MTNNANSADREEWDLGLNCSVSTRCAVKEFWNHFTDPTIILNITNPLFKNEYVLLASTAQIITIYRIDRFMFSHRLIKTV